jgi:hypothetical protein
MLQTSAFLLLLASACLVAYIRGGKPERLVAYSFAGLLIGELILHLSVHDSLKVNAGHFIIETIAWLYLVAIALNAHRFWTLVVAALQTLSVASYIVPIFELGLQPMVFPIMRVAASYPVLILMIIGTWRHQRRLGKFGLDPAWSR